MIRNYILIAWRNLIRYRFFTLINITGLAIGLAACWILGLYVYHETSYDKYFDKSERLYRVVNTASWSGGNLNLAPTSAPFGPVLAKDYEEVESMTRIVTDGNNTLETNGARFDIKSLFIADPSFFQLFSYHFLAGDPGTALNAPEGLVLTESLAHKMFGSALNAMGKSVVINPPAVFRVTGVVQDVPANTHFNFEAVRVLPADYQADGWQNFNIYTYLLLKQGASAATLQQKMKGFYDKYLKAHMGEGVTYNMLLQRVQDIHLHSNMDYEMGANGNIIYVYIFMCAAVLILLIACINYMNMSTARAVSRIREVGLRKALGSGRWQVAGLFMAEALILTVLAAILASLTVYIVLPYFNNITGVQFKIWDAGMVRTIAVVLLITVVTGLLSGTYPSLIMSGFNMVGSLKGKASIPSHNRLRKGLVIFQFSIAILLTASALVAYKQLDYVMHTNMGFNRDQVLTFHLPSVESRNHIPAMKQQLLQNRLIQGVAAASNPIGGNDIGGHGFYFEVNGKLPDATMLAQNFFVDEDFVQTMELKILQGRNFSVQGEGDRYNGVLINEALVKKLNWKDPIGKRVEFDIDKNTRVSRVVVGVVNDFHYYSLQHKIAPLVLEMAPVVKMEDNLYVKVSKENIPAAIDHIKKVYSQFDHEHTFDYSFLDETFAKQYAKERVQEKIFLLFTVLALFIACLGLLGLAAFTAAQRKKEIGVRKALGASVWGIVRLLSLDFLKLLIVAVLVAVPLAWWYMDRWLNQFAYHIDAGPGIFILTAAVVVFLALLTVSYHAIRSALANPVQSLRSPD